MSEESVLFAVMIVMMLFIYLLRPEKHVNTYNECEDFYKYLNTTGLTNDKLRWCLEMYKHYQD